MNLKNAKVFTSKSVGTGPSSYEKRIYRAAVSQRLRNTAYIQSFLHRNEFRRGYWEILNHVPYTRPIFLVLLMTVTGRSNLSVGEICSFHTTVLRIQVLWVPIGLLDTCKWWWRLPSKRLESITLQRSVKTQNNLTHNVFNSFQTV